jgi:hypothetical protein
VLTCGLRSTTGDLERESVVRAWFFDLPLTRDVPEAWAELIPRIFYDSNVAYRRREPAESAWVDCESFGIAPIRLEDLLEWRDGQLPPFPWIEQDRSKVWEPAVCFSIDDQGHYDFLSADDFTELLLHRLLIARKIDADGFVAFMDRYSGQMKLGEGRRILADAARRYLNLVSVRVGTGGFRKRPGDLPLECGPVLPQDV